MTGHFYTILKKQKEKFDHVESSEPSRMEN